MRRLALIGNPNIGKTSLFNTLTNSYEYVGNWSGVTVEKKVGQVKKLNKEIIDLPGVYTLNPISRDESVVTTFLLEEQIDGLLNIIDASNFERNMQLTLDLLELRKPIIICLNMMDVAKKKGISINIEKLQSTLGVPVIPIVARTGKGIEGIYQALESTSQLEQHFTLTYDTPIETAIATIEDLLQNVAAEQKRWCAIQFLMGNQAIDAFLQNEDYLHKIQTIRTALATEIGESLSGAITNQRDSYIATIKNELVIQEKSEKQWTEHIDKVLTHPVLGVPIFLALMYFMFQATFAWIGGPFRSFGSLCW
ncbi:Ferrous iron transport protein B OS=Lysinibacillus sphaericus OX=1421 GN=LS41612_08250 PE=3 SV=1 [Lysinibacillus sphaericus]